MRLVNAYYLNTKLGMTEYDYVGKVCIVDYVELHKICKRDKAKGIFWKFVEDGKVFCGAS